MSSPSVPSLWLCLPTETSSVLFQVKTCWLPIQDRFVSKFSLPSLKAELGQCVKGWCSTQAHQPTDRFMCSTILNFFFVVVFCFAASFVSKFLFCCSVLLCGIFRFQINPIQRHGGTKVVLFDKIRVECRAADQLPTADEFIRSPKSQIPNPMKQATRE